MKKKTAAPAASRKSGPISGALGRLLWICAVCGVVFAVGVLVGRGNAPVRFDIPDLKQRLDNLQKKAYQEEIDRYQIEGKPSETKKPLKYREALKETKPPKKAKAPASPPAESMPPKQVQKPKPPEVSEPKTPDRSASRETDTLTLQVASMKDAESADELVQRLKDQGFDAYRVAADIPGKGTWHRVRVGAFSDRSAAMAVAAKLKKMGKAPIIVKR
jgi:cell division septation protein DedD